MLFVNVFQYRYVCLPVCLLQKIECFAVSHVISASLSAAADAAGLYGNVVIVVVQSEAAAQQHQSDVHLFHAHNQLQVPLLTYLPLYH